MEGLQKAYSSAMSQAQESAAKLSSLASSPSSSSSGMGSSSSFSTDQSRLLITRSPRQSVSLWTCSKLCGVCFVAGIFVGYTLKKRGRRWVSKLLQRWKDE